MSTLVVAIPQLLFTASLKAQSNDRPNIVFIMADDLGWADVAFHGGNAPTPHLDRLANEGVELTEHHVAPVCSPTRAGLLTGRYWSRFGITTPTNTLALPPDTVTLPRALKEVGYETCLVGKWHLGSLPEWGPNQFGFDHAYGSLAGGVSPWNHRYKKGPFTKTWHRNGVLLDEAGHVTDLLTDEAVSWIESRGNAPFFLYVPYTAVHLPLKEPQHWLDRVPESITGDVARHYAASVMHLDDGVGRIVTALKSKGIFRDTLLVFTSDNGGSTVENNDLKYPDDNCPTGRLTGNNQPLRGGKGTLYEGGTRVPTILSWPARCEASQIATPLMITDWMPTFCALTGYRPPRDLKWDGDDLSTLLTKRTPLAPRSLYSVGPRERAVSIRRGNWKLILRGTGEDQETELFDLSTDEAEARNLAETETKRVEALKQELQRIAGADRDAVAR